MTPSPAETLFHWLCVKDEPRPADLIIGFGHFDMEIPRQCGRLFRAGFAPRILLTGGIGAGTADLGKPEGVAFRELLLREFPEIPDASVLVESRSTNTGENIEFSAALLREENAASCFEKGLRTVLAVASPYRMRRVLLTMKKQYPDIRVFGCPSDSGFGEQTALFASKGQDLASLLPGEVERLERYAQLGYIASEPLPREIKAAYEATKK